jgi:hypothetical protein
MALTDTAIKTAKPATKPAKMYDSGGLLLLISAGRESNPRPCRRR